MYLKITHKKNQKGINRHGKIVESYWDKSTNTSRQRTLMNLKSINSEEDLKRAKQILNKMKQGIVLTDLNKIEIISSKQYGMTYTTNKLLEKYGIDEILQSELSENKATFNIYEIIKALIINRLVKPSSELSALEWIDEEYTEDLNIKGHQIYRALDYLIPKKETIEKKILNALKGKMNLDLNKSHYDLTSTYFEGKCCEIALYGYSRDHRKDRPQVVVGLVMIDGMPVYHEVHKGNTADKTTLENIKKNLKEKLGVEDTIIIADGGLLTEENLEVLEDSGQKYILGVPRRNNKMAEKYLTQEIDGKENQVAIHIGDEVIEREKTEYTRRYILCLDKNTKKERLKTLGEIKHKKEEALKDLQKRYAESQDKKKKKRGRKMTKEGMINQAYQILGKNKRLFRIEENDGRLNIFFNEDAYKYEEDIAGKFLLVTNSDKGAGEVMKSYKELQTVENAFDECKNFLYVRPIFHWRPHRVKAHIFVCMLAFLIESIIEKFSKESARVTLRELGMIHINEINTKEGSRKVLTKLTKQNIKILRELKIQKPLIS